MVLLSFFRVYYNAGFRCFGLCVVSGLSVVFGLIVWCDWFVLLVYFGSICDFTSSGSFGCGY